MKQIFSNLYNKKVPWKQVILKLSLIKNPFLHSSAIHRMVFATSIEKFLNIETNKFIKFLLLYFTSSARFETVTFKNNVYYPHRDTCNVNFSNNFEFHASNKTCSKGPQHFSISALWTFESQLSHIYEYFAKC